MVKQNNKKIQVNINIKLEIISNFLPTFFRCTSECVKVRSKSKKNVVENSCGTCDGERMRAR